MFSWSPIARRGGSSVYRRRTRSCPERRDAEKSVDLINQLAALRTRRRAPVASVHGDLFETVVPPRALRESPTSPVLASCHGAAGVWWWDVLAWEMPTTVSSRWKASGVAPDVVLRL